MQKKLVMQVKDMFSNETALTIQKNSLLIGQYLLPIMLKLIPAIFIAQIAYVSWQIILSGKNTSFPDFVVSGDAVNAPSNWNWAKKSVNTAGVTKHVAPKKTYRFTSLAVKITGLIYRSSGSSVVIISSQLNKNMVLSEQETLGKTDILVHKINIDSVIFVEADKEFTVTWNRDQLAFVNEYNKLNDAKKTNNLRTSTNPDNDRMVFAPTINAKNKTYNLSTKAESILKTIATKPQNILKYLSFFPIYNNGKMTGAKVTIIGQRQVFESMGLYTGDIITTVNGKGVGSLKTSYIKKAMSSDNVILGITRNGKYQTVTINR